MALNWGGFAQGFGNGLMIGNAIKGAIRENDIKNIREQGLAEAQSARQDALAQADKSVVESAAPTTGQVAPDRPEAYTQAVPTPPSFNPAAGGLTGGAPTTDAAPPAAQGLAPVTPPAATPNAATPAPNVPVAPEAPPAAPKPFMVGSQGFDTREQASAAARKNVGSEKDFFLKVAVPQITQKLTEMGEVDKADAWQKYADDQQTRKNMETWSQMARSAAAGNYEKAADHAFELYKHYDDGVTPISKELVKDDNGNVTGFNVKLKNDETGEERSQFIGTREITELGLSALSPPAMFEQMYRRQTAADSAAASARVKAQHDAATAARDLAKQGMIENRADKREAAKATAAAARDERQHGYKLEELTTAEGLKQANLGKAETVKVQAKIDLLQKNGYSPEQVKELLPGLMNVGEFKKGTSPEERRAMFTNELAKDPLFQQKSIEEQTKAVDALMSVAGAGQQPRRPQPAAPAAAPAATAPPAGKTPVFDTKTGQIVYR